MVGSGSNGREQRKEQTCLVIPTAQHVLDHLFSIECVLVSHDAECGESPINGIHPEVCGEMISEIIFALTDISDYGSEYGVCSRFRVIVCRIRARVRVACLVCSSSYSISVRHVPVNARFCAIFSYVALAAICFMLARPSPFADIVNVPP